MILDLNSIIYIRLHTRDTVLKYGNVIIVPDLAQVLVLAV